MPYSVRRRSALVSLSLAGIVVVLVVSGFLVMQSVDVVDKGTILPYTEGKVYLVRVLNSPTFYVEPEVRPTKSVLNAAVLTAIAGMTALAAVLARHGPTTHARRVVRFFAVTALGTGYLAADELLGLHESLGHNMQFLMRLPGISRPDDAVVVGYLIPIAVYVIAFRSFLTKSRRAIALVAVTVALAVVAAWLDTVGTTLEDPFEVLSVGTLLAATLTFIEDNLQTLIAQTQTSSGEVQVT